MPHQTNEQSSQQPYIFPSHQPNMPTHQPNSGITELRNEMNQLKDTLSQHWSTRDHRPHQAHEHSEIDRLCSQIPNLVIQLKHPARSNAPRRPQSQYRPPRYSDQRRYNRNSCQGSWPPLLFQGTKNNNQFRGPQRNYGNPKRNSYSNNTNMNSGSPSQTTTSFVGAARNPIMLLKIVTRFPQAASSAQI